MDVFRARPGGGAREVPALGQTRAIWPKRPQFYMGNGHDAEFPNERGVRSTFEIRPWLSNWDIPPVYDQPRRRNSTAWRR